MLLNGFNRQKFCVYTSNLCMHLLLSIKAFYFGFVQLILSIDFQDARFTNESQHQVGVKAGAAAVLEVPNTLDACTAPTSLFAIFWEGRILIKCSDNNLKSTSCALQVQQYCSRQGSGALTIRVVLIMIMKA